MSKDFSFLKIMPVSPNLPETIDFEQDHDEKLVCIPADRAEDWQKNLGLKRKVSYRTIDFFVDVENLIAMLEEIVAETDSDTCDALCKLHVCYREMYFHPAA